MEQQPTDNNKKHSSVHIYDEYCDIIEKDVVIENSKCNKRSSCNVAHCPFVNPVRTNYLGDEKEQW